VDRRKFLNKLGRFAVVSALLPIITAISPPKELKLYKKPDKNNKADMANCVFYIDPDNRLYINNNAYRNKNGGWELHS